MTHAKQYAFEEDVKQAILDIINSLHKWTNKVSPNDPNFKETPRRVARAYSEIFGGLFEDGETIREILSKTFPAKSDEMITVGPIEVWSFCAHHFLPVHMHVWVSYVPKGKVLGLSKLARLAELCAKKPGLQEDVTTDIADLLFKHLKPKGAACLIRGRHLCMEMRGVKKNAVTTSTALRGAFFKPEVRQEFMDAVHADVASGNSL